MGKALITEGLLTAIADEIRSKLGVETPFTPAQMAAAIGSIPTGITPTGTLNISQNGAHDVTEYASANVNVQPNLQSKTTTQNGTVTADQGYDGLSSVLVNVSGGGGGGGDILWGYTNPTASQGNESDIYLRVNRPYVKNSGALFIDTGYSGGPDSKYEIFFEVGSQSSNWPTPFGVRDSASSVTNCVGIHLARSERNYNGATVSWGNSQTVIDGIGANSLNGKECRMLLQSGSLGVTVDGVTTIYPINTGALTATQAHLCLFGMIAGGAIQGWSYIEMELYSFKIYEGNTLVHSFVPAKDNNDIACIYDEVNDEYKYKGGSGALEYDEGYVIHKVYIKHNGIWVDCIGADLSEVIS